MAILEMLKWGVPPILQLIVILMLFNRKVDKTMDGDFIEFFSGQGEVSRGLRDRGLVGSSHDINNSELMDLCSISGFLCFG